MAIVKLRAPLAELAGGYRELALEGATVAEVLQELERSHPQVRGWIMDEQRRIREHVNVFVNGARGREETPVSPEDRIHVIPSISGG
ncbi:MAG: MoaD/ThiS family protein [Thermoleophilia bacterium]|nr:MoaD/ThiS family protein [Thermoleophilia bacterium]